MDIDDEEVEDTLWIAASEGSLPRVEGFLRSLGAKHVDIADEHGFTPLMAAVQYGQTVLADELIKRGADPNLRDMEGATALHHCDSAACARLLVEKGADLNAKNRDGETPLMLKKSDMKELEDEFSDDEDKSALALLIVALNEMELARANAEAKRMRA